MGQNILQAPSRMSRHARSLSAHEAAGEPEVLSQNQLPLIFHARDADLTCESSSLIVQAKEGNVDSAEGGADNDSDEEVQLPFIAQQACVGPSRSCTVHLVSAKVIFEIDSHLTPEAL